jgi:hypothetical protein
MKKLLLLGWCLTCLFACQTEQESESELDPEITEALDSLAEKGPPQVVLESRGAVGSYVGAFEGEVIVYEKNPSATNLINITIHEFRDGKVKGQSIVAGNDRPFFGTYTEDGSNYIIKVTEPGDDKHDGRFDFTIDTMEYVMTGKWYCNDPGVAVPVRSYSLKKRDFKYVAEYMLTEDIVGAEFYDPTNQTEKYEAVTADVLTVNASTDELEEKDIENMYQGDLEVIRNTIYARHGYSFRNRRMRYLFDNFVKWYMPVSVDVRHKLTAIEKQNIELIKRYEKHADKYYDEFSR